MIFGIDCLLLLAMFASGYVFLYEGDSEGNVRTIFGIVTTRYATQGGYCFMALIVLFVFFNFMVMMVKEFL